MHAPLRSDAQIGEPLTDDPLSGDPFRARLALRIGITGHRPPRLKPEHLPAVRDRCAAVLALLREAADAVHAENRDLFAPERPRLVLVTPLADGADQLAAQLMLDAGEVIDACLPFAPPIYRADYEGEAADRFDRLLLAARRVLILPGSAADRTQAYREVGEVTISQCDILLAVWDGEPAQGIGGTPEIVADAVARQLPVVVIDAAGAAPPTLLWNTDNTALHDSPTVHTVGRHDAAAALPAVVRDLLAPPPGSRELLRDLREAGGDGWLRPIGYPLLMVATGVRTPRQAFARPSLQDSAEQLNPLLTCAHATGPEAAAISEHVRRRFAAADVAANTFATRYRGGYVTSFTLAALAVALALAGLLAPGWKLGFVLAELVTIGVIMLRTHTANKAAWHRRWLDARHLAELLRLLPMAASLGDLSILRQGDNEGRTPFDWYARASAREVSICEGEINEARVLAVRQQALDLVEDQIRYHRLNAGRMRAVEHRLHKAGEWLFILTIASGLAWLAAKALGVEHAQVLGTDATMLAVFASALLPALGGALYGIRKQGDFSGSAERSRVSAAKLTKLRLAMIADRPDYRCLTGRVRRLGEIMLSEVEQWRLLCAIRPVELPG